MAKASIQLIAAIRKAAENIENGSSYQWGHMGSCNCGHLAQVVSRFDRGEIHRRAMQRHGDWNEQLNDYCPTSGLPMDDVIDELVAIGFDTDDLKHLEKLSDKKILNELPRQVNHLRHNVRDDVVLYMRTWADMLEEKLVEKLKLPDLSEPEVREKAAML